MKRLILAVLVFMALPSLDAAGKTYTYSPAGVEVELPDYWGVRDDQSTLVASPRDGTLLLIFGVVAETALDKALANLDRHLKNFVQSPKIDAKAERTAINGMKGYSLGASGRTKGKRVDIAVLLLEAKTGKILLVLGIGEKGKFEKHIPVVEQILATLKPL